MGDISQYQEATKLLEAGDIQTRKVQIKEVQIKEVQIKDQIKVVPISQAEASSMEVRSFMVDRMATNQYQGAIK